MSERFRPQEHVVAAGKLYPEAWRSIDRMRAARGKQLPGWPDWCFLPISGAAATVAEDAGVSVPLLPLHYPERVADAGRLAALAAWRVSQGIYRFDRELYAGVIRTLINGDIPSEVLYRLPQWAVYIETPGLSVAGQSLLGAFVHLEYDVTTQRTELRFVLDQSESLTPIPLHLGSWSLLESLQKSFREAVHQAEKYTSLDVSALDGYEGQLGGLAAELAPLVSLTLYLCSETEEIGEPQHRPSNPIPKRTKQGSRIFAPERATVWNVGERIGAALRQAYQEAETESPATEAHERSSPRAHIRRGHWHSFRVGPMKRPDGTAIPTAERRIEVHWLPPIPVNIRREQHNPNPRTP